MLLKAENLVKNYGKLEVLKDVSLQIEKGSFVAIVGPSGAGKSTLLHLLGTLDNPKSGSVSLDGKYVHNLSSVKQADFRNKNIGFVFQAHHLLPEFTALENVSFPLWIAGVSKEEAKRRATEVLNAVGLSHRTQHKPTELSGGEQQRVAIARAVVCKPSIIFADEPTGNLDTANAHAIHELFLHLLNHYQLTFVVVTHNEKLAMLADRVLTMKDGNIVSDEINKKNITRPR